MGKNSLIGLNLLRSIPEGSPQPLFPFHIAADQLIDIPKTYPWMKLETVRYWKEFISDQVNNNN